MNKIKVCQVLNAFRVGGAETVALDIARSLSNDRFESLAVAVIEPHTNAEPDMQRRFREAGVTTFTLHHGHFRDPRTLWDMVRFFRRHRPDIVHGHNRLSDYWGCRCAKWAGVPATLLTRHLVYRDMQPHHIARYRKLAAKLPRVIAVSEAVRQHCLETEGMPEDTVRVVVNGIDTDRFRPAAPADREAKRSELGIEPGEAMLLFVGRLTQQKAPEAFVALVQQLRNRGLKVKGLICGHGDLTAVLEKLCGETEGVSLLGLRNDVPALLGACDLFVSTSRNEGLPLNVMEAMAAGAAFVGPDIDQVVQLVRDEPMLSDGLYPRPPATGAVPEDLIERWTDVTASRLENQDLLQRCGDRGRAVIEERFSLQKMVQAHVEIYEGLVADRLHAVRQ